MASNKYKDFAELNKGLTKNLKKVISDFYMRGGIEEVATKTTSDVSKRTILGYGVNKSGSNKVRLKPLSTPYKKYRKKLKKVGMLNVKTTPAKSNLTLTGEMISNLSFKISQKDLILISPMKKFLKQRAKWNADKGRKFLFLSRNEIQRSQKLTSKIITNFVKKYL